MQPVGQPAGHPVMNKDDLKRQFRMMLVEMTKEKFTDPNEHIAYVEPVLNYVLDGSIPLKANKIINGE